MCATVFESIGERVRLFHGVRCEHHGLVDLELFDHGPHVLAIHRVHTRGRLILRGEAG